MSRIPLHCVVCDIYDTADQFNLFPWPYFNRSRLNLAIMG